MADSRLMRPTLLLLAVSLLSLPSARAGEGVPAGKSEILFHDAHFHLTNYVQKGLTAKGFLKIMGRKVGRVALFGIPLQQKWDYFVSGDRAPAYYLHSDASLYYYSFTDAIIAEEYRRLPPEDQKRFDPMITGFNPTDMHATDHIRKVLTLYPGVFSGIGEFSIHKEFVSPKISGHTASLKNKAFDRILSLAAEAGLVALVHCDVNTVRSPGETTAHFDDLRKVLRAHKDTTVIWAHTGLGRFVKPTKDHVKLLAQMLADGELKNVSFDLSWDEVAKYVVSSDETAREWAGLIARYPDRFLFGTDSVAPRDQEKYLSSYHAYTKLWELLDAKAAKMVKQGNYERIFDGANTKIRAWEARQAGERPAARKAAALRTGKRAEPVAVAR
ncbi:amidohydrolase family protein [Planctomycetota bacterium]